MEANVDSLTDFLQDSLATRVPNMHDYEVRKSVLNLTLRWYGTLTLEEKWKIARDVGGNRYAMSTMEMIDALMEKLLKENT